MKPINQNTKLIIYNKDKLRKFLYELKYVQDINPVEIIINEKDIMYGIDLYVDLPEIVIEFPLTIEQINEHKYKIYDKTFKKEK